MFLMQSTTKRAGICETELVNQILRVASINARNRLVVNSA